MSEGSEDMKVDPSRAQALVSQLNSVKDRIASVASGRNVRLVAVSKLKPANDILALHQEPASVAHFGENYAQELTQKAALLPQTVQWHFIGGLQSGHCKPLAKIPNLFCVSSVDTYKKAQLLNTARTNLISQDPDIAKLSLHVQVNTSGEESKSGCAPGAETVKLCKNVLELCPSLRLLGLMTIGAIARSQATAAAADEGESGEGTNEDFETLKAQRDLVEKELGLDQGSLELSMGMSQDFEGAIKMGSGEVRIGSTIFGQRPAKGDAKIKE